MQILITFGCLDLTMLFKSKKKSSNIESIHTLTQTRISYYRLMTNQLWEKMKKMNRKEEEEQQQHREYMAKKISLNVN